MKIYGTTNPQQVSGAVQRYGSVIGLKPEMERRYRELHADVWQSVQSCLASSNVHNYSIYITELEGKKYLFSYFEYTGQDFEADMQDIAEDPETQRWWQETDPCQLPLSNRAEGDNWTSMERVFFLSQSED